MKNDLYNTIVPYIAEHGYKCNNSGSYRNAAVDRLHAVISHLYSPERYFVYLLNKSFLIRKYDDFNNNETRESRRSLSFI